MSGYVYFFQRQSGAVKIGFTSGNPYTRLSSVRTSSDEPVSMLAAIAGSLADEAEYHRNFREFRLSGEWFAPDAEIIECADDLPPFDVADIPRRTNNEYVEKARAWVDTAVQRMAVMRGISRTDAGEAFSREAGLTKTYAHWLLTGKARSIAVDDFEKIKAARASVAEAYLAHVHTELLALRGMGGTPEHLAEVEALLSRARALLEG